MCAVNLNTFQRARYLRLFTGERSVTGCVRSHGSVPHPNSDHGQCDAAVIIRLACDGIHTVSLRHTVQLQFLREDILAAYSHAF